MNNYDSNINYGLAEIKNEGDTYGQESEECQKTKWCEFSYKTQTQIESHVMGAFRGIIDKYISSADEYAELECYLAKLHTEYCIPKDFQ
jgi:hypothetical protein